MYQQWYRYDLDLSELAYRRPAGHRQHLRCPIIVYIALPFEGIARKSSVRVVAASKVKLRIFWVLGCSIEAPAHSFRCGKLRVLIGLRHAEDRMQESQGLAMANT